MIRQDLTAFIFARGGSKGILKKNLQIIGGLPLIGHAIRCGLESRYINRMIVSTDSEEIAEISRDLGAETPFMRPELLATDSSSELLSWRHAIQAMPEYFAVESCPPFISLPATSPLRTASDVDNAIEKYCSSHLQKDVLLAISKSRRNPYLNMVTIGDDDLVHIVNDNSKATRRQDVPDVYDISTAIYVANSNYVLSCQRIIDGRVGYIEIPPERAIDIDDEYDLHLARLLLEQPYINKKAGSLF
jgi:CMP-N-acetylneuraminic acid synthetase